MKLINKTKNNQEILSSLIEAKTFWEKTIGLLGKSTLQDSCGMLFVSCNSIHTIGMKFPIDVLFLDKNGMVLKVVFCLKPFRFLFGPLSTKYVVESLCGMFKDNVQKGDVLEWEGLYG